MASSSSPSPYDARVKPPLTLLLAAPRGFCAGVDRAIRIVELALEKYGHPIYVRHEIVHNRFVVERLESLGAVFIDELEQAPEGAHVVFSAHGVPKSVPAEAQRRQMHYLDATCPLVSKVHAEAERHFKDGATILLIGHAGHPEVVGTMGQLPEGAILLIEDVEDAETIQPTGGLLAYITQTTLSVDDTAEIIAVLKRRFPQLGGPAKEDICYATTNRQEAVKAIVSDVDTLLVIGAANSSNSMRLVEVAKKFGATTSALIRSVADIDWSTLEGVKTVGLSAGASAPEFLVNEVIEGFRERFDVILREITVTTEKVAFKLPRVLAE